MLYLMCLTESQSWQNNTEVAHCPILIATALGQTVSCDIMTAQDCTIPVYIHYAKFILHLQDDAEVEYVAEDEIEESDLSDFEVRLSVFILMILQ